MSPQAHIWGLVSWPLPQPGRHSKLKRLSPPQAINCVLSCHGSKCGWAPDTGQKPLSPWAKINHHYLSRALPVFQKAGQYRETGMGVIVGMSVPFGQKNNFQCLIARNYMCISKELVEKVWVFSTQNNYVSEVASMLVLIITHYAYVLKYNVYLIKLKYNVP